MTRCNPYRYFSTRSYSFSPDKMQTGSESLLSLFAMESCSSIQCSQTMYLQISIQQFLRPLNKERYSSPFLLKNPPYTNSASCIAGIKSKDQCTRTRVPWRLCIVHLFYHSIWENFCFFGFIAITYFSDTFIYFLRPVSLLQIQYLHDRHIASLTF